MLWLRYLIVLSALVALSACTPAIEEAWEKEKQAWATYNANPLLEMSGFTTLFPVASDRTEKEVKRVCITDGQPRTATFSGAADPYHYSQCPYTPYFPENLAVQNLNHPAAR